MGKVIRLSDDSINLLEEIRLLKISIFENMVDEFPSIENDLERYKNMDISALINHSLFDLVCDLKRDLRDIETNVQ